MYLCQPKVGSTVECVAFVVCRPVESVLFRVFAVFKNRRNRQFVTVNE